MKPLLLEATENTTGQFSLQTALLLLTVLFSGLVAGLLYSYSCSVNIGLKALPDEGYLRAMQSINVAIQNPWFFTSFMGLLLLFPLTTWMLRSPQTPASFYLLLAATALYFTGVFGVTAAGNIPLNNRLARFDISSASPDKIAAMRALFENSWNRFHLVRTLAAILSFALAIVSLLKFKS